VKFTETGGVVLRTSAAEPGDGRRRFEVADTGVGISPQLHEEVFAAFRQAHHPRPPEARGWG
jgi:signal transduction histidine kinase